MRRWGNIPYSKGRKSQVKRSAADDPRFRDFCVHLTPEKRLATTRGDLHAIEV